ncbi:type I restriction-modification system subunit M [Phascolarctobacterium faecium]|uniref:type I restriction-modification system subunit M n=1 Tax=Phascolarctobacterium faecium TaxID=33025 RepID=UPI00352186FF
MDNQTYNQIVSFIWGIADDCLRDVYVRGKYRDVILPMVVIRRLDAVLEGTKPEVLKTKEMLDKAGIKNQTEALCKTAGQSFCNSSAFILKDLTSRAQQQKLKADFIAYLDGFSPNVQEILEKFKFRNQIDTMIEADILGAVIEKFVSPTINLSPYPVLGDMDEVKIAGLDNHTMGVIFEELIRKFNEENNEEAGEHFTPRDVVELMADCIFMPVADKIMDTTYSVYDGASGTGGMLTVAHDRLEKLAIEQQKKVSIHLFGQEINPETYAITKADMLLKGEGEEAEHIMFGSTLSSDGFPSSQFDFMLSNPPYGKAWKTDADKLGGKKDITDPRFVTNFADMSDFSMIPRVSDGQMLFMLNNISKMKENTILGSRIAEVHNGSSLFTGDAGQGESNARRYIIENDLLECIIALPEKMFYNTGIGTFIWILSNKKEARRKGKVQLVDATSLKAPLRKNLGEKNCELTPELRQQILELYMNFEENEYSKIFANHEFGYWKITVLQPELDADGKPVCDKKGNPKADKEKTDTEQIPFTYEGGISAFMEKEVFPFAPDAWIDDKKTQIGYELSFTKYFYKPIQLREVADIVADIKALEEETGGLLNEIIGG